VEGLGEWDDATGTDVEAADREEGDLEEMGDVEGLDDDEGGLDHSEETAAGETELGDELEDGEEA
jgi:hypothetical protein